jgi:hypothetical protein
MDDWKIEARNDARASNAIRGEQIPPELTPKIPKSKRFSPTMDTFNATTEYVNSLDFRDNALEAQMAKISTNAIQDKLGWKPSTIKSDVTKEMILDYQQEMSKPIVVDGVKFNYHPSTVDIDPIVYEALEFEYSDEQIADLEREKRIAINELRGLINDFDNQISFIEKIKRDYDRESSKARDVPTYNAVTLAFERRMIDEKATLEELKNQITFKESAIERLNLAITNNERNKKINNAEKVRVAKENAVRLKAYKEDLNQLNKGRLNIEQQPNESDDEFRNRLRDTGMMTYDEDAMARSAELYNREKMKERMIEIHRDTAMTGNALKSFDADQLFKMNKNWSTLKQNFIKIYGFNSPAVRDRDIVNFFTSQINPVVNAQNTGDLYPVDRDFLSSEVPEATAVVIEAEDPFLAPPLFPALPPLPTSLPPITEVSTVARARPRLAKKYQINAFSKADLDAYVQQLAPELLDAFRQVRFKADKITFLEQNGLVEPAITTPVKALPVKSGEGIKPISHNLPNKIEFGKITISPKKLYYDNVLAIHHKSGKAFTGVPNTTVSDKFVSIIMNLLKGQKPSLKDFSTLDLNEKGLYDSLIYMAGLQKEVDNTFHDTKNNLKNRLELLEGEIGAGNNNPKLKKELLYLLSKMVKTGMVGGGDAKRYYQSVIGNQGSPMTPPKKGKF